MAGSPGAFLANLAGAVATLARYREPQLFLYRVRLALEAASVAKVRESWPIRSDGLTFYVRSPVEALIATAKHESRLAKQFEFREGGFFLDIGSHIGEYSLRAAKKGMVVLCWEPDPSNRALLARNFAANGLAATIYPEALGDEGTVLPFHQSREQSSFDSGRGPTIPVRVATLDSYDLPGADLVKVDTEGYEAKVLTGARKTLTEHRPFLIVELHPFYVPETAERCTSVIREAGYGTIRNLAIGRTRYLLASAD